MTRRRVPSPSPCLRRVFVWCSVLGVWDWSSVRGPVCLFSASTSLWCCEAADQGRHLHLSLSHLKRLCPFLLSGGEGSCGSVSHYTSVKCCLWTLDEQQVLTDGIKKEVSESCRSAIWLLEGCCYNPTKAFSSPAWTSLLSSSFPHRTNASSSGTISLVFCWTFQFCVSSLSSGNLLKISMT